MVISRLAIGKRCILLCYCLLLCFFTSCTWLSVRPVVKIGLLAPFEGLHRRTGYEALAAMRLALEEYDGTAMKIIPLALHVDGDEVGENSAVSRTLAKLLRDSTVQAVVGPYDLTLQEKIANMYGELEMLWYLPLGLDSASQDAVTMFGLHSNRLAATLALAEGVAAGAKANGAERLLIAGWEGQWQELTLRSALNRYSLPLPTVLFVDSQGIEEPPSAGDILFWLGSAERAVDFFQSNPRIFMAVREIWFGPIGGDPILPERLFSLRIKAETAVPTSLSVAQTILDDPLPIQEKIYWVTWLDANADSIGQTLSPTAYFTYRATQVAIAALDPTYDLTASSWYIGYFQLHPDGQSTKLSCGCDEGRSVYLTQSAVSHSELN